MKYGLMLTATIVLLLSFGLQRVQGQYTHDWAWEQRLRLWKGPHNCALAGNSGAKAVDMEEMHDGTEDWRAVGVAVQDADDDEMYTVFYHWDGSRWVKEDSVLVNTWQSGASGAFAFSPHGQDERSAAHCIFYNAAGDKIVYADTTYQYRGVSPWADGKELCYGVQNGNIAIDAWKDGGSGPLIPDTMIYLAFCANPTGEPEDLGVYVARSTNAGASWLGPNVIRNCEPNGISIAAHRNSEFACLAFGEYENGSYKVRVYRTADYGVNWTLERTWEDARNPCLAHARDVNQVVLAWIGTTDNSVRFVVKKNMTAPGEPPYYEWYGGTSGIPVGGFSRAGAHVTYSHPSVALTDELDENNTSRLATFAAQVNVDWLGTYTIASTHVPFRFDAAGRLWYYFPYGEHWLGRDHCTHSANPSLAAQDFEVEGENDFHAACVWVQDGSPADAADNATARFARYIRVPSRHTVLPPPISDGHGPRLRPAPDGSLVFCSGEGANIHAGPVAPDGTTLPFLVGDGELSSIAVDGDGEVWTAYTRDHALLCDIADGDTCVTVFAGDSTVIPGQPSIALYPTTGTGGYVACVAFPVFDTANGESRILFAKLDAENLVLDTIHEANALSDSCPCVNVFGDSIYVTWQDDDLPVSSLLEYEINTWSAPGSWTALDSVPGIGSQPMSAIDRDYLHLVWREVDDVDATEVIRTATRYVGSDTSQVQGWIAGPGATLSDAYPKACPVYAGEGVVVWQEKAGVTNPWSVRANVWGDTVTLVSATTDNYHPHALAQKSAVSPSTDQMRVSLLWTDGVAFEVDSAIYDTGVTRFRVDSICHSNASGGATWPSTGSKLVRKPDGDSLFSVYQDAGMFSMYAWSADGSSWSRESLFPDLTAGGGTAAGGSIPALAFDSTGRLWVVLGVSAMPDSGDSTNRVFGSYRSADSWSTPQLLYQVRYDSGWIGMPSLAGAADDEVSCAYAAFTVGWMAGGASLVVAKFDGDSVVTSSVVPPAMMPDMPCIAAAPAEGGDDLHLSWLSNGVVCYTMTPDPVPADSWNPSPLSWETPVYLSNSTVWSWGAVVGASRTKVAVSWTDPGDWQSAIMADIFGRVRSADSTYDNWEPVVNLSQSSNTWSENPYVALAGDSLVVAWDEQVTADWSVFDIMASVNCQAPFALTDNEGQATCPHIVLQDEVSGESTLAYVHAVWSQNYGTWPCEVGYKKYLLNPSGDGQMSGGGPVIQPLLYACRPNPFSQRTLISYQFPRAGHVLLRVYDASGRVVRTLQDGMQMPGIYTANWDGRDGRGRTVANGVYFYRVDAPGLRDTKKAVVTR